MALPRKLKNLNLFNDGVTYIGQVGEVTLPKLTRKMEEWRGGGMNAPIKMDQGMEALEIEAVCGGLIGGAFSWLAIRSYKWLPKPILRLQQRRPYVFVLLCALTVAVAGLGAPIFGSGSELTFELLHSQKQVSWLYAPLKFVGFLATSLSGLPGGIFTPSLSMSATTGAPVTRAAFSVLRIFAVCALVIAPPAAV